MTTDLLKLAEMCEAATGPDWQLDYSIGAAALGADTPVASIPRYTTSIDAAMTLVPKGLFHILWGHRSRSDERPAATVGDEIGKHDTSMALALCAAALRSRAALQDVGV